MMPRDRRRRVLVGRLRAVPAGAIITLAISSVALPATINNTYIGPNQGLWSAPANWSAGLVPNNDIDSYKVFLDNPIGRNTILDVSSTVDELTISNPNSLTVPAGHNVALTWGSPGTLTNSGTIRADGGTLALTGSQCNNNGGIIEAINFSTLKDNAVSGGIYPTINGGTLRAQSGGAMTFHGTLNNVTITADSGSSVTLINGGPSFGTRLCMSPINRRSPQHQGTGAMIELHGASQLITTSDAMTNCTIQADAQALTQFSAGNFSGSIANEGIIQLLASVNLVGTTILTGSGTVIFSAPSSPPSITVSTSASFSSTNTILGRGTISVLGQFKNSGVIIATSSSSGFTLFGGSSPGSIINTGTLRADGGSLSLKGFVTNGGGIIEGKNASRVFITNATISGGSLSISGTAFSSNPPGETNLITGLTITNSQVDLTSLSGTAFLTAGTFNFSGALNSNINVIGSSVSVSNHLDLLGGCTLKVTSGSITVTGPTTLASIFVLLSPSTLFDASAGIFFNSTLPNSQSVGVIAGDGFISVGAGASLISDSVNLPTKSIGLGLGAKHVIRPGGTIPSHVKLLGLNGTVNAWKALFDLTNNALIVGSGGNVANQLKQGANLGAWNGTGGITSSAAMVAGTTSTATALAYATGATFTVGNGLTSFMGQSFLPTDTLVMYTLAGDGNMDGAVTFGDFLGLQNHYNSASDWEGGDFNYDGVATFADFLILQNNYNKVLIVPGGSGSLVGAEGMGRAGEGSTSGAVPEPGSVGILLMGGVWCVKRRGRNRKWKMVNR